MIGTMLVMLALAGQSPSGPGRSPGAEELIGRLGSPRYAEREAAAADLEKLGRMALPSLLARREHRDLEVRSRVNALITKIEGSLLLEPTPIVLDFDDRPLGEVVAGIAKRSDLPLSLGPGSQAGQRVTLREERPVPFWSAIDRLAEAADLGYAVASPVVVNGRELGFALAPSLPKPHGLMSDHGPFRVNLMSLHYQRDLSFLGRPAGQIPHLGGPGIPGTAPNVATTPDGRTILEQFFVRLQVSAEPRLALRQTGPLKLATAVDDLGHSLVPPAPANNPGTATIHYGFGSTDVGSLQFQVSLKRPESPGRSIRLLRGAIPVSVATRRPDPLVIALDGAVGKTFRNEDATITVHELRPMNPAAGAGSPYTLDLSVIAHASRTTAAPAPAQDFDPWMPRADVGPLQLELVDASGRPTNWYVSSTQPNGDELRMTLIMNGPSQGPPAILRHFGTVRAGAEIPFEFRDVPMP